MLYFMHFHIKGLKLLKNFIAKCLMETLSYSHQLINSFFLNKSILDSSIFCALYRKACDRIK